MKDTLFNIHDIVLVLAISLSLILAVRACLNTQVNPRRRILLGVFFLMQAGVFLDALLFWGDAVKYTVFHYSPWLTTLFSVCSFAIGPVFYVCFRSFTHSTESSAYKTLLHLSPAILTPFYLYWACHQYPLEQQAHYLLEFAIFSQHDVFFFLFLTLKKLVPLLYGLSCLYGFWIVRKQNPGRTSSAPYYLYSLFPLIWGWVLLTHIAGQWLPLNISDVLGILGNYANLMVMLGLLLQAPKSLQITPESALQPSSSRTNSYLASLGGAAAFFNAGSLASPSTKSARPSSSPSFGVVPQPEYAASIMEFRASSPKPTTESVFLQEPLPNQEKSWLGKNEQILDEPPIRDTSLGEHSEAETRFVTEEKFASSEIAATKAAPDNPLPDNPLHEEIQALAQSIQDYTTTHRPYLNAQLTLERFAAQVEVSPRQVSAAINRCFEQNFHEYINRFRIEEAKRLLVDPDFHHLTIIEIAQKAGFNSKATFHRFFKAFVGCTPTCYREQTACAEHE